MGCVAAAMWINAAQDLKWVKCLYKVHYRIRKAIAMVFNVLVEMFVQNGF